MKVGQRVTRIPRSLGEFDPATGLTRYRPATGQVEYIHPAGRYHVVAFSVAGGTVRESFDGVKP